MIDPDRDRARRAIRGDREALAALYERHAGALLGYLAKSCADRRTAEEVFQETWMKVMERMSAFDPERGTFRSWLYRVAANASIDRIRRERVRRTEPLDAHVGAGGVRRSDVVPSDAPGPDRTGESAVLRDAIERELRRLFPLQRAAVLLRHQQGLSYAEIADALDIPPGTAKSMVHRGAKALREALADWNPKSPVDPTVENAP